MISIIVTSRVLGNVNHNIKELVRSLAEHSQQPEEVELLVKFDNDDDAAYEVNASLLSRTLPFRIKTCCGDRGRGYIDIHHGYNQLLSMVNPRCQIVIAMADDFTVERDWDAALRSAATGGGDYFIIHHRPHPLPKRRFLKYRSETWEPKFNLETNMFHGENLYIVDEAPAWSFKLLSACGGGVGNSDYFEKQMSSGNLVFPVSFTDAWTLCLEWSLWHNHNLNITRFLPTKLIQRKTCEVDQPGNERWHIRKTNFAFIKSREFVDLVYGQAKRIALLVQKEYVAR
jgi:hypothetical protein